MKTPAPDTFAEDEGRARRGGGNGEERYVGCDVANTREEKRLDGGGNIVVAERSLERRLLRDGVEQGGVEGEGSERGIGSGDGIDRAA